MSTVTTTDLDGAVEDAAAHLYVWALKDIPQDLRDALADARDRETSTTAEVTGHDLERGWIDPRDEEAGQKAQRQRRLEPGAHRHQRVRHGGPEARGEDHPPQ